MVNKMSTSFPYLQIDTLEKTKLVGKPDKGTRIYRREGTFQESGEWCEAMDGLFGEKFVSPGGVCMFVKASRAAVHKRMKEGRLTAFCFHIVHDERTFFGNVRKAKAAPFVFIPISECKAWASELDAKRGGRTFAGNERNRPTQTRRKVTVLAPIAAREKAQAAEIGSAWPNLNEAGFLD